MPTEDPIEQRHVTVEVDVAFGEGETLEGVMEEVLFAGASWRVLDLQGPGGRWPTVEVSGPFGAVLMTVTAMCGGDEEQARELLG